MDKWIIDRIKTVKTADDYIKPFKTKKEIELVEIKKTLDKLSKLGL